MTTTMATSPESWVPICSDDDDGTAPSLARLAAPVAAVVEESTEARPEVEEDEEDEEDDDDYRLPEESIDLAAAAAAAVQEVDVEEAVEDEPPFVDEEAEEADEDEGFFGKFKGVEGQFDVLEVSVDCSRGVNMTGLMLGQNRPDGLLHVRVCKQAIPHLGIALKPLCCVRKTEVP